MLDHVLLCRLMQVKYRSKILMERNVPRVRKVGSSVSVGMKARKQQCPGDGQGSPHSKKNPFTFLEASTGRTGIKPPKAACL